MISMSAIVVITAAAAFMGVANPSSAHGLTPLGDPVIMLVQDLFTR
jgi:hypothetical protein